MGNQSAHIASWDVPAGYLCECARASERERKRERERERERERGGGGGREGKRGRAREGYLAQVRVEVEGGVEGFGVVDVRKVNVPHLQRDRHLKHTEIQ